MDNKDTTGRFGGVHNFLNDIHLFNTNFIESLYVQHGTGHHNTNKQKTLSLPYLPCMRREGQFIKLCRSYEYWLEQVSRASTQQGYKSCSESSGKLTRENNLHVEFMEAEPYGLKSTKMLSMAEA